MNAWPAVKLLWGSADSVSVRVRSLQLSPAQTAELLWEARGLSGIAMSAASVREGPLRLSDVSFRQARPSAARARARSTTPT